MTRFKLFRSAVCAAFCLLGVGSPSAAPINLALESNGGIATQSSTLSSLGNDGQLQVAARAIDGLTNGDWYSGKITHTNSESAPWWRVDLGLGGGYISEIDIWNRTDCCAARLNNFDVSVFKGNVLVWSSLNNSYTLASPKAIFSFGSPIVGDRVVIALETTDYLSLAEVQVWATPTPEPATLALLAFGLAGLGFSRRKKA